MRVVYNYYSAPVATSEKETFSFENELCTFSPPPSPYTLLTNEQTLCFQETKTILFCQAQS